MIFYKINEFSNQKVCVICEFSTMDVFVKSSFLIEILLKSIKSFFIAKQIKISIFKKKFDVAISSNSRDK